MPKARRQSAVDELLELLDLSDFRRHRIYELSGGMQQRVAIGRVLAMEPKILLMDEPFGALDALTRTMLQGRLREIWQAKQFTAMFITHNVEEALTLGTNVVVMGGPPHPVPAPGSRRRCGRPQRAAGQHAGRSARTRDVGLRPASVLSSLSRQGE